MIPPISTAGFLQTRDDATIRAIIAQGQSDLGMPPFGASYGGLLSDDEIDAVVAYVRSWAANPLVIEPTLPPTPTPTPVGLSTTEIYANLCAQCHGTFGAGGSGPALNTAEFQQSGMEQYIFDAINLGEENTPMIAWGKILSKDQITLLVKYVLGLSGTSTGTPQVGTPSFNSDVLPILEDNCTVCHGTMGGWNASTYADVMTSGTHGPVVEPGDADNSLLVQKLVGKQPNGSSMPPSGKLSDAEIQVIIDWINAGALEK
jgi:cbb3-type cytochrome c oxidase subunit III